MDGGRKLGRTFGKKVEDPGLRGGLSKKLNSRRTMKKVEIKWLLRFTINQGEVLVAW